MYQTFLSRALVAVAVTGGAFLLGRVLAHTTVQDGSLAAEECELQTACPATACTEDCRYRGLPDAPALPEARCMPSVSRYLKPSPAQVDTMEFRPTDARRGDFQPHQL